MNRNDLCLCGSGKKYKKCCIENYDSKYDTIAENDPAWYRLRVAEGNIMDDHLTPYVKKTFGMEIFDKGFDAFCLDENFDDEYHKNLYDSIFPSWVLFYWKGADDINQSMAMRYLKQFRYRLNPLDHHFIETMNNAYYSFYLVTAVVYEQSMTLKDILLQTEHVVKEYKGTHSLKPGIVIFTCIITLDDISLCVGTAAFEVPSRYHIRLIDYKKELEQTAGEPLTGNLLRTYDDELRAMYFTLIRTVNESMTLQNTDGDLVESCAIHYSLHIKPQEALLKLLPLTLSKDPTEFENDTPIKIPWLKKDNKLHGHWENTIMGNLTIADNELIIDVNSQARVKKIRTLIDKYLGNAARHLKTTIESMELINKKHTSGLQASKQKRNDFNETPEAKAIMKAFAKRHWDNWIYESIPALGGLTPLEATRSKEGREKLEALLFDFENKGRRLPGDFITPDVQALRKKLGL